MVTVIGVRFKKVGKIYYFDPRDLTVAAGQHVIVETARGVECGECATANTQVEESSVVSPLKPIIRIATETDLQVARGNEQQAKEAHAIARQKIAEHGLEMRLVAVECTFDLNKILFYFTSEGRVDFRDLVKDLASVFRTRIELRQIGVRDEAKMIGGLGICGRELCCSSYLEDFQPVSINMAKEQNLSLNPAKISGTCGRLMCCLKYEHEVYTELQRITPRNESLVETPDGLGTVLSSQMLRSQLKVQLENDPENPRIYRCEECTCIRNGRAKKNNNSQCGTPGHSCGQGGGCNCPSKNNATPEINPLEVQAPVAVGMPEQPKRERRPNKERTPQQQSENTEKRRRPRSGNEQQTEHKQEKTARAPQPKPTENAENTENAEVKKRRRRRGGANRNKPRAEGNAPAQNTSES